MNAQHPSIDDLFDHLVRRSDAVAAHAATCAACRQELSLLADVAAALREMEPPPLSAADADDMIAAALGVFDEMSGTSAVSAHPDEVVSERTVDPAPRAANRPAWALGIASTLAAAWLGWLIGAQTPAPEGAEVSAPPVQLAAVRDATRDAWLDIGEGERIHLAGNAQRIEFGESLAVENVGPARLRIGRTREKEKVIEVLSGTVVVEASDRAPDERIAVLTPQGEVLVTGTVFFVEVDAGVVEVGVRQGSTRFVGAGLTEALSAGEAVVVTAPGKAARRPLTSEEGVACDAATREHPLPEVAAVVAAEVVPPVRSAASAPTRPVAALPPSAPAAKPVAPAATERPGVAESRSPSELLATALDAQRRASRAASGAERDQWTAERIRLLEVLVANYGDSPEAGTGLVRLASAHEAAGRTQAAVARYRAYVGRGPSAPLYADALAGLCRLAPSEAPCR